MNKIQNMNNKQVIRINENQLKQIVTESVKKMLKEDYRNRNKTNENKATELATKYTKISVDGKQLPLKEMIDACLEMAQWKEKQFIKLIEEELYGYISHSDYFTKEDYYAFINTIKMKLH